MKTISFLLLNSFLLLASAQAVQLEDYFRKHIEFKELVPEYGFSLDDDHRALLEDLVFRQEKTDTFDTIFNAVSEAAASSRCEETRDIDTILRGIANLLI